jgi:ribonuclease R
MCVLVITDITEDGDILAEPVKWDAKRKPPYIVVTESGKQAAVAKGDRVLAKMRKISAHLYQGLVIRVLAEEQALPVLGVFVSAADGGIIEPISRKRKESFMVARDDTAGAHNGELVSGVTLPGMPSLGMSYAKITERLGSLDTPRAASLIASHMHNLRSVFPQAALVEAEQAEPPVMAPGRTDLRSIPLVTIDGEDARDFDDAVFAEKDGSGWHLVIAIADVAYYVAEGSPLDNEAFERGNSVYFPDRVIPMLPERLSNGLCSLNPDEDRYCLAVHIWIDAQGVTQRYEFVRGLMRSRARLTYNQVECFSPSPLEGEGRGEGVSSADSTNKIPPLPTLPLKGGGLEIEVLTANLFGAYKALASERDRRGALDLNLPEYKILFDEAGNVAAIMPRARLESHRLIEAFMIAANVAAADFLLKQKMPAIYRVHEQPSEEKLDDLVTFLKLSGYSLHVGAGIKAAHFNRVLKASENEANVAVIHTAVLRSQMQAYYAHENLGHFGLSLQKYCHFTSPIRRYADLVVHRSLVMAIKHEKTSPQRHLADVALHISETERRAMMAERDASDRYKVSFMSKHVNGTFEGAVVSLNEYGLFVSLMENGVTGFIPVRNLGRDFFTYDKRHACFKGQRSKQVYGIGQAMMIRVQSANAITGSLIFEPEGMVGQAPPLRAKKHERDKKAPRKFKKKR